MSWLLRKLDSLGGAVFAAALGGAASQAQAFTDAYLQRLGGRLDEAAMVLNQARDGSLLPDASAATRDQLAADFAARVEHLAALRDALLDVTPLWRPFALIGRMDPAIAAGTLDAFVPALPLTMATGVHVLAGLLLGLLLWETCKAPGVAVRRYRRQQRSRRTARVRLSQQQQRRREPSLGTAPRSPREP